MKLYKYLFMGVAAFMLASCEDYLDVNVDPNNPTSVTPDLVLPTGQNYTAQLISGNRRSNHLANVMMYNWSETYGFAWYNAEFTYQVNTSFYAALFDQAYTNALKQYHLLDTEYQGTEYNNYRAIGKIMKAFHFQYLVDLYGDVPYTEALGRSVESTPVYDDAQAIYNDLLVQLDTAITLINSVDGDNAALVPGEDDGMFNGDMLSWKQFANTLKVRILTRESDVAPAAEIDAAVASINAEGSGYITESVAIDLGYLNEQGKQNPFWNAFGFAVDGTVTLTNDATCATQFVLDYLNNTSDPRINSLYELPATGHRGVNQGAPQDANDDNADMVSNIGPGLLKGADQASIIFTEAESRFNLAELALKGFAVGGTPEQHYNAGIAASFDQLQVLDPNDANFPDPEETALANPASYYGQPVQNVSYASSTDKLEAIITQKWIATNGTTAAQSWFDYSRTGFPRNLPVSSEASTADRPVRLFYPASELNTNAENVPNQPDAFTNKIFWAN